MQYFVILNYEPMYLITIIFNRNWIENNHIQKLQLEHQLFW